MIYCIHIITFKLTHTHKLLIVKHVIIYYSLDGDNIVISITKNYFTRVYCFDIINIRRF